MCPPIPKLLPVQAIHPLLEAVLGSMLREGTHTLSPVATRRVYHSTERAAELRYVSPDCVRLGRMQKGRQSIDFDTYASEHFDFLRRCVLTATRGEVTATGVVNTLPVWPR